MRADNDAVRGWAADRSARVGAARGRCVEPTDRQTGHRYRDPMTFGSQPAGFEVQLAADADLVYQALFEIVVERHKLKKHDDEARLIFFRSRTSAFSWGEDTVAEVIESTPGTVLRLTVVGRFASVLHAGVLQQSANDLIAAVSERVRILAAAEAVEPPIVIDYRRTDGSNGQVVCTRDTYDQQLERITTRGYTVISTGWA